MKLQPHLTGLPDGKKREGKEKEASSEMRANSDPGLTQDLHAQGQKLGQDSRENTHTNISRSETVTPQRQ